MNQPIIGRRSVETLQSSDWYAMKISKELYKECVWYIMNILIIHQNHNHPDRALSSNHKFCWVVCSITIFGTSSSRLIEKNIFYG
jgi:hypothetical protein